MTSHRAEPARTAPSVHPSTDPVHAAAPTARPDAPHAAPALRPIEWAGRKPAVRAALAVGSPVGVGR